MAVDAGSVLGDKEGIGLLLDLDSTGSVVEALPVAIAEGSGTLRSRLTAILRYEPAGPSGPAHFVRQEPEAFFAEQPNTTSTPTLPPPSPAAQRPTPGQIPEAKPSPTVSEEPTSATTWCIIVVLIAAASGLLWFVLNGRK